MFSGKRYKNKSLTTTLIKLPAIDQALETLNLVVKYYFFFMTAAFEPPAGRT